MAANKKFIANNFSVDVSGLHAENSKRCGRAIEISPAYCAVTLERMATAFPGIEIERIADDGRQ